MQRSIATGTESSVDSRHVAIVDAAPAPLASPSVAGEPACFHCGTPVGGANIARDEKQFCCQGCLTVFELLTENGLADFYQLGAAAGVRVQQQSREAEFNFMDEPAVRQRLVEFSNDDITRITFRLPAIHCIACVWLLENLFRLKPGVGQSQVNFLRKEATITFSTHTIKLSQIAALLVSLGYQPDLKFADLDQAPKNTVSRRLWLQLGVAGFAFGNIMLFSISSYLGLDRFSGPVLEKIFGWISLVLALPVIAYSAADYWRSAWVSLRQKVLNVEVPIAIGIAALIARSVYEIVGATGPGYFDSLTGLIFFLLCGRLFQQKTFARLAFERDYKSFFPLAVRRQGQTGEETIALAQLQIGDTLMIRSGELIPADSVLIRGSALIDYSFVTGEAKPVEKAPGDYLYAGGRQVGGSVQVQTSKAVSQSHLTSLWNQDAFQKNAAAALATLTNAYSRIFSKVVLALALGTIVFWSFREPAVALRAFTAVLIVACPCALALAAPFALGTAQRILGRNDVYLKNAGVVERLAKINAVVFDKTGTLTTAGAGSLRWNGRPLTELETGWISAMTSNSAHPLSTRIAKTLTPFNVQETVTDFCETPGCGMEGKLAGHQILIGSRAWLKSRGIHSGFETGAIDGRQPLETLSPGSRVELAIDGQYRGGFELANALRPELEGLFADLSRDCELALLSGDGEAERARFRPLFKRDDLLHFNQSPAGKLDFVRRLQNSGKTVMMVGDGLNDAGALKQSDVGVAVVEDISAFSPASDVILSAKRVTQLNELLKFSRQSVRVVKLSLFISALYNVVGIAIAATGRLSPVTCAILMPLSSVTVVAFACGMTAILGRTRFGARANRKDAVRTDGPESDSAFQKSARATTAIDAVSAAMPLEALP